MDLQPMTMDVNEARRAFLEYRQAFREYANEIDGELMRGYKELAAGKQLIRLAETITAGGVDELGRPRLAFARADERAIAFWRDMRGALQYEPTARTRVASRRRTFPQGTLPAWPMDKTVGDSWANWRADVPIIPPRFRPPYNLSNYHVLWEAVWRRQTRRAAVDPALLKHIGGDLYAVLATWDLTPLERAVLEMR
jgi:hypothetical protein